MKKILALLILGGLWFHFYHIGKADSYGPGIFAASAPYQYETSMDQFRADDFIFHPIADFEVEARVLDASISYLDRKGWLAPLQLVIGWGKMSDESVYQNVDISIFNHQYKWDIESPDLISEEQVMTSTASLHLIPASKEIRKKMLDIKIGDIVSLRGSLVNIKRTTGWEWKTSIKRNDKGENAGEILYVKDVNIIVPGSRVIY
ncbi:hypothetical protein [Thiomicrorhabdus sp. 6S3-12]|uniref:hypothetical protein n=1 Tax=Thiomicrorhabdus sp. 6S3-12 TaxID=2819681 RepID=UPI001AAD22ED|nr:hypothetical protein [Thiomicrorhabdus sp. 6S3-12]MBO1925167.1 hypothetical protein [Thiomicrorhabdus sp. 6S3-12]